MIFSRSKRGRRIAIFGGSFNPPHIGHTAILRWLGDLGIFDEVWVVPCFQHPFDKPLAPFEHRLEMCRLAFSKVGVPLNVLQVERELGGKSRTVRTLEHLMEQNPDDTFRLVVGDDVTEDFEDWHDFDRIKQLVEVIKVPRGPKSPIPDVSSTEIRRRMKAGEQFRDMIEPEVAIYLVTKALYRDQ